MPKQNHNHKQTDCACAHQKPKKKLTSGGQISKIQTQISPVVP